VNLKLMINSANTASILGGKTILGTEIENDSSLEKIVEQGLPYQTLEKLIAHIFPTDKSKYYDIIPASNWNRRKKTGYLNAEESQKIERIARVFAYAVEIWASEAKARYFMQKPHPMLEDRTPFQASLTELGAKQVEEILNRIRFGIVA
jgi:putative toxin-antitoxin system antitoxin component (TIGR02293 family)